MTSGNARIVLGAEYDQTLCRRLLDELGARGAHEIDKWWGVAGSQDISHLEVSISGATLVIEAETYVGLSIEGPYDLVSDIAAKLSEAVSRG
jgi:hypothetical protein